MSDVVPIEVEAMQDELTSRSAPRVKTRFETLYASGVGVLADISYSGAHLEETTVRPDVGTEIRIYVFLQPVFPVEIAGQVVRHTENGFAIEYKDLDPRVRRLVDDAAAVVAHPKR